MDTRLETLNGALRPRPLTVIKMETIDRKSDFGQIYAELFTSMQELYDVCGQREARGFDAGDRLSPNYKCRDPDWAGFKDGTSLKDDAFSGRIDPSIIQPIITSTNKLHAVKGARVGVVHDVMGFQPDVNAVLNGEPEYMLAVRHTPRPGRVIRLFINLGAHCGVSSSTMNAAGSALIETVAGMEISGQYRLEIYVGDSFARQPLYAVGVRIKTASQPMNIARMAWPMVNSSAFSRGIAFGWYNRTPKKVRELSGYGAPWSGTDYGLRREFKKEMRARGLTVLGISDIIEWVKNGRDIETAILDEIKEANSL